MKPATILATLATALPLATAWQNTCKMDRVDGGFFVTVEGQDIGEQVEGDAFCNGLWDNLRISSSSGTCRSLGNRGLLWSFHADQWANGGDVTSAWWRATKNGFGDLQCVIPA